MPYWADQLHFHLVASFPSTLQIIHEYGFPGLCRPRMRNISKDSLLRLCIWAELATYPCSLFISDKAPRFARPSSHACFSVDLSVRCFRLLGLAFAEESPSPTTTAYRVVQVNATLRT